MLSMNPSLSFEVGSSNTTLDCRKPVQQAHSGASKNLAQGGISWWPQAWQALIADSKHANRCLGRAAAVADALMQSDYVRQLMREGPKTSRQGKAA